MTETGEVEHAERLDRALWLWAEEKWRREQLLAQRDSWWATVNAERDALQARIDAALALMDYWDEHGGSIPQGHRLRAALQGDQTVDAGEPCVCDTDFTCLARHSEDA